MASLNQRKPIGGAGNHRVVGSVELQGRALVANPANAQNLFVLVTLLTLRIALSGEDVFEEDLLKSPTLGRGKRALKRI